MKQTIVMDDKKISVWNPAYDVKLYFRDCSIGMFCPKCGEKLDIDADDDDTLCKCGERFYLSMIVYRLAYVGDAPLDPDDASEMAADLGAVDIVDGNIVDDEGNPVEELPGDVDDGVAGTG